MNYYKISKYNPHNYFNGIYMLDEWTDYSDIGEQFQGKILTEEEYISVENNYISCVEDIVEQVGVAGFFVKSYENYEDDMKWKENQYIEKNLLHEIVKACLRNTCWCKLENQNMFIHFGYDFYLYVAFPMEEAIMDKICIKNSLYCMKQKSPYM